MNLMGSSSLFFLANSSLEQLLLQLGSWEGKLCGELFAEGLD